MAFSSKHLRGCARFGTSLSALMLNILLPSGTAEVLRPVSVNSLVTDSIFSSPLYRFFGVRDMFFSFAVPGAQPDTAMDPPQIIPQGLKL